MTLDNKGCKTTSRVEIFIKGALPPRHIFVSTSNWHCNVALLLFLTKK
jgi:hypothetical protein